MAMRVVAWPARCRAKLTKPVSIMMSRWVEMNRWGVADGQALQADDAEIEDGLAD